MIYSIMTRYRLIFFKTLVFIWAVFFGPHINLIQAQALDVLIDPGHGGIDHGGQSIANTYEEPIVYDVSKKLQAELKKLQISSEITRETNEGLGLNERVQLTLKKKPKVFISIHANTHRDKHISGTEFYIEPSKSILGHQDFLSFLSITNKSSTGSLTKVYNTRFNYPELDKYDISKTTQVILLDMLRMKTRRESLNLAAELKKNWPYHAEIREAKFFLLQSLPFPCVLVELGYISNAKDFKKLNQESVRLELAHKLATGLSHYLKADKKVGS